MKFVVYLIVAVQLSLASCARILVVLPTPSYSHTLVYKTIYRELALRGHELVVFTPNPLNDPSLKNVREIDLSHFYKLAADIPLESFVTAYAMSSVSFLQDQMLKVSREIFLHTEMRKLVNDTNERFDLLLVEWNVNPSLTVLSKRFDCPMVGMRSLGLRLEGHDSVGNPTNPSYIPVAYMDFEENFWGRLDNFVLSVLWRLHYYLFVVPEAQRIADEYLPEYSGNVLEVQKNVSIVLTNTHPILTGARPLVPAIIEVGGIHLRRESHIVPENITKFLDDAKEGVVYFSLGTVIRSANLDPNIIKTIISCFSQLPYKVIWKWEGKDIEGLSSNVKIANWVPQEAILKHRNVKAFVSQCGLLSIMEAVDNRVPLVGIPFFADQHVNARRIEKLKIGKRIGIDDLNKETLTYAIKTVIQDSNYKKNIKKVKIIFHDLPMKPMDKAIWWIEYVLRHKGARHLRSPAVDLNWISYLLLDVIAVLLFFLINFCILAYYITIYLMRGFQSLMPGNVVKEKVN